MRGQSFICQKKGTDLLLHSCCAPCAGEIMEALAASDIKTTVYFYNPNIHPKEEYEIRKMKIDVFVKN
jgi:predicted adenine nucleotide alpha hydrolase (AANH) superfamily ATPase